jgi:hypothetical protein
MLLAQVGRDAGKRKESRLFASWDGKPTTRLLRHRDSLNRPLLARRHAKLGALLGTTIPTAMEEAADLRAADEVYEACTAFLRDKTRDRQQFDLIFDENCSYGFRRNLWGMKPLGITVAFLALGAIVVLLLIDPPGARVGHRIGTVAVAGVMNLLLLLGWLFVFTPGWVRVPADAYAERLLEACERL